MSHDGTVGQHEARHAHVGDVVLQAEVLALCSQRSLKLREVGPNVIPHTVGNDGQVALAGEAAVYVAANGSHDGVVGALNHGDLVVELGPRA